MVLDDWLPAAHATLDRHRVVEAPRATTWDALLEADLTEETLTRAVREAKALPGRLVRAWQALDLPEALATPAVLAPAGGTEPADAPPRPVTFAWLWERGPFVELETVPEAEIVAGAIGRLWGADPGVRLIEPATFATREDPDHVKIALGLSLERYGDARTLLSVEARLKATDAPTRRRIAWTWPVVAPLAGWWLDRCLDVVEQRAVAEAG